MGEPRSVKMGKKMQSSTDQLFVNHFAIDLFSNNIFDNLRLSKIWIILNSDESK